MYEHTLLCLQITRSDIRQHVKLVVSLDSKSDHEEQLEQVAYVTICNVLHLL